MVISVFFYRFCVGTTVAESLFFDARGRNDVMHCYLEHLLVF
jgi:hypothetical protein